MAQRTMDVQKTDWWEHVIKLSDLRTRLREITPALMNDFLATREQRDLGGAFGGPERVTTIAWSDIQEIFRHPGGWERFHSRYPNATGYLELSRVGFDGRAGKALVYMGHHYGLVGGIGRLVLLRQGQNGWEVSGWNLIWES